MNKRTGIFRLWYAMKNSTNGLFYILKSEAAFRTELFLAVMLSPFSYVLGQRRASDTIILAFVILSVLLFEIINTALELAIDRISLDFNELSGFAKDLGSAAILVSLIFATCVWVFLGSSFLIK